MASLLHFLHQPFTQLPTIACQKLLRLGHLGGVVIRADIANAGGAASFDKILQTRAAAIGKDRIGTGAQAKNFLSRQHRLLNALDAGIGADINPLAFFLAAIFLQAGKGVIARQQDIGIHFVIAQHDVKAGAQGFNQAGLQQQGFRF